MVADDSPRYPCLMPNCEGVFTRAADLDRHYTTVHRQGGLIDCRHVWCGRTGDRGFSRRDHYREHLREVHREDIPRGRQGAGVANTQSGTIARVRGSRVPLERRRRCFGIRENGPGQMILDRGWKLIARTTHILAHYGTEAQATPIPIVIPEVGTLAC